MAAERYIAQVELLVRTLPYFAEEIIFALKGGTAINLFNRDLPRLSVDIDLTYLPVKDRPESLTEINEAMDRLCESISSGIRGAQAYRIPGAGGGATRLQVRHRSAEIKIETSPVTRGVVHEPERRMVIDAVEEAYGFAEMQVVAFEDLFGGKLHAALDRQHPRDLFDVTLLYENVGLTDGLFRTFLVYVASSGRPAHELLDPRRHSLDAPYAHEFEGMTRRAVSIRELHETREQLIRDIHSRLDESAQRFLLTLHNAEPDFQTIGLPKAGELPAVRWKLHNLGMLITQNPAKHADQRAALEALFGRI
jgi:predicted nucleotidyltransferase component of viral defense system